MQNLSTALELQEKLEAGLNTIDPKLHLEVHVRVLHAGAWWIVHVFMPIGTLPIVQEFTIKNIHKHMEMNKLWPEKACRGKNFLSTFPDRVLKGSERIGRIMYTFWLPIPPLRTSADFEKFFPAGQQNEISYV